MATRRTIRRTYTARSWQFTLSFWLVVIVGVAMCVAAILGYVWKGETWADAMANWVSSLCFAIGMFIPVSMSWQVAKYKGTLWKVLWVIFVVLIVVGLVFRILGHF